MTSWIAQLEQSFLKNVSDKDALDAAKSVVKKMFGIDMKGYSVKCDADITYVFWFTKQGSPTIEGQINVKKKMFDLKVASPSGN
ncbi:hypothetical protein NW801_11915 [Brevibacillus laterosporus]|uniref:Uncharacterized protein n=1 Tax=Brevibacillus halotolerans TaxID=1507437 RepID=A0ABT4HXF4_9BACL|nr:MULTISPECIES: hypothetical protein [Brevibacillus]MCR8985744.1 hypothetical protein [Brevibacillus laterosporus]MCZ0831478.1 hypothetical protein [Brevibacillus halotolerans]GIO03242.1 hypothetical protein J5TS2_39100 [Brevibacillus halotolerans]